MKKRKTIEEREDDEEQKIRYLVNTDLIEGFIKDQAEEIQDISTMRDQAMAQLSHRDLKKPAMLPNQTMASIAELKKELQKAKGNSPLQLSILETLVMKAAGQEKIGFLHEKICIWLDLNRLQEAENDANALLALQTNSANRLLCSRILNRKKDFFGAMTQFLRCGVKSDDVAVSELYNSLIFQLQKSNFVHSLSCIGSNINYTLGDGTQDSSQKPKYPPELKGKIIVQACCGEFHTLVLASSCPHIARKEICNKDVFECCGGVDIIGWGENSHGQIMNYPTQVKFYLGTSEKAISFRFLSRF